MEPLLAEIINKNNFRETSPSEYAGPCPKCGGAMRFKINTVTKAYRCSSCGLSGQTAGLATLFPVEFDSEKAFQLLRYLNGTIGAEYPIGALEWLKKEKPSVLKSLYELENGVDAAYLAEDMPGLKGAADLLKRSYRKAYKLFTDQPPVIEVQTEFF